jgi:non-specific protein-tyrosine kinase
MANTNNHSNSPLEHLQEEVMCPRDRTKMGWVSPSYNVSRSVELVPEKVIENRCVAFSGQIEMEAYRILRTRIMRRIGTDGGNTIMVTSAIPGEGKTLTSINLAMTFAREFSQTVLLVDCDLHLQRIHQVLGYESEKGLADFFIDAEPLPNLIVWPGIEKLTVISGGRTIDASSEFLGSQGMKELVEDMKNRYKDRYVIFDAPPILIGADTMALAPLVDFIVVVVRAGYTSAKDLKSALGMLPKEKVMGMVLNRGVSSEQEYYYVKYGG